ncbi:hypothetical protein X875_17770 [Mannheimia varigena USDA-ARS-USMARC-1388]|nr:hypothetical protein X875_17770 [Mannheimia varigena USDA-ARS-USMARC-1388]
MPYFLADAIPFNIKDGFFSKPEAKCIIFVQIIDLTFFE